MKRVIVSVGAFFLIGSAAAASLLQPAEPQTQQQIVESGKRIAVNHPQADWIGVGGPEEDEDVAAAPRRPVRTAEQLRAGSAWAQHGGLGDSYQGVGGPEEDEERLYPPCRSRGDDRCQQRR